MSSRRVALLLVLLAARVSAQDHSWLYVTSQAQPTPFMPGGPIVVREVVLLPSGPGPITREIRLSGALGSPPVVTFDGRLVAWILTPDGAAEPGLALLDRGTGAISVLPGLGGRALVADPTALRLFVFRAVGGSAIDTIVVVEPGVVRSVSIEPIHLLGPLTTDGRDVFVVRRTVDQGGTTWRDHVSVLDPLTGAERRRLPAFEAFGGPSALAVSRDGQRLFVTRERSPNVIAFDAVTGAELASTTIPLSPSTINVLGGLTVDDRYHRLFVTKAASSGSAGVSRSAVVLDAQTLATIGGGFASERVVDPVQGITFGEGGWWDRYYGCRSVAVETWGSASVPVSIVDVSLDGGCPRLGLATAPQAPATLTATRVGRRVTLEWPTVPGAMAYQIEAGSAPGLADLAVLTAADARPFVVDPVPVGTYYVRVRALNYVGRGAPSPERLIGVP